ncbi:MAG TPA: TIGR03013 family PEP-CTERM/XrtA system glycosyltransferase [Planctomycetes bacterium]|nr:TIGR03013 family PEP-CTERM/XrtA system glycosyltransferase [Planctomycetota bacterium]
MRHVLRHYLPIRKALLVASETVLLWTVLCVGMTSHLWSVDRELQHALAERSMTPPQALTRCILSAFLATVLAQIAISFNELYDFRVSSSRYERASRFLISAGSSIFLVTLATAAAVSFGSPSAYPFPGLPFSQAILLQAFSLAAGFVLLYLWRHLFHILIRRTSLSQRVLILGSGRWAERVADELSGRGDSGFEVAAVLSAEAGRGERRRGERRGSRSGGTGNPWFEAGVGHPENEPSGPRPIGAKVDVAGSSAPRLVARAPERPPEEGTQPSPATRREPLDQLAQRLGVSDIVVAFEDRRGHLPTEELLRCRLQGIAVHEAESFFERVSGKVPAEAMRPSYLIFNRGFLQHPLGRVAKRLFDIAFGILILALAWPVMILAAIAVRLDSPGPILFRQERTGEHGRPFTLMKFRSMRQDAEKKTGPVWAQENDPRVTRVGRFLRKTRIDELPQLFNVLAGSMSFVGPRPERPTFVRELAEQIPYYHQRHIVKPGLTGWAQVNYPYGNTVEDALQKLQFDLFYIRHQSFLFDLSIVLDTVRTVVLRKGT